jgi:ATP-dependent Clp protease ATP-binding subunit ClpB
VLFSSLTLDEIKQIVDLQTEDLRRRLAERGIGLELSDEARDFIARKAYDPVYGARPLKRYLQHEVETRIGRALIAGEITEGSTIQVDVDDGALTTAIETPETVPAA